MARSKVLKSNATTTDTQEAARLAKEAEVFATCDTAIETIFKAAEKANVAKTAAEAEADVARGMREKMYIYLAKAAHDGDYTPAMTDAALKSAIRKWYVGNDPDAKFTVAMSVMQSELSRAMHPKVRAQVPAIMAPWIAAWDDDATREAMRQKFHSRHNAVTQALQLAIGSEAVVNKKGVTTTPAVPSVICDSADKVATWVKAHPRVTRAPKAGGNGNGNAPEVDPTLSPRKQAEWRVEQLVNAVKAVAADFPETGKACFNAVLRALSTCTGAVLVPGPKAEPAPAPAPAAAEPVAGVSNMVDDAMADDDDAIAAMLLQRYKARLAAAK